jgi:NAD-dependent dihydropyrimidine dehydrogenase PreA subunit
MEATMRARRTIVKIDEDKCNGCGQCATACAEGAIAIVDGKARLISEIYCDGLGACIGECPTGALTIEQREADEFDQAAVEAHLARLGTSLHAQHAHGAAHPPFACPSAAARSLAREPAAAATHEAIPSQLTNWPVQIMLVPPTAPYLKGARLLIAADCAPFAFADFHLQFLGGRVLLVGCPKLDDAAFYRTKLAQIISANEIRDIQVVYMEVPCCSGLVRIVREAMREAGRQVPLALTKIGIRGEAKERTREEAGPKRE